MTDTTAAPETTGLISLDIFDVRKHDAVITIHNPATGNHRTFRIKTVTKGNMEGKRIVSILTGPDNTSDYQGFGFVDDRGIQVWRKHTSTTAEKSQYEVFAAMLMDPARFAAKGAEYLVEGRCRRCGRRLTTPESVTNSIGPECAKK